MLGTAPRLRHRNPGVSPAIESIVRTCLDADPARRYPSAHALKEDLERCIDAGMNDTITKPFREDVLRQKLERWLGVKTEV